MCLMSMTRKVGSCRRRRTKVLTWVYKFGRRTLVIRQRREDMEEQEEEEGYIGVDGEAVVDDLDHEYYPSMNLVKRLLLKSKIQGADQARMNGETLHYYSCRHYRSGLPQRSRAPLFQ